MHGKFILPVNVFGGNGITCHFQIIKDHTDVKGYASHCLSDITNAVVLDETNRESSYSGHIFRAVSF